MWIAVKRWSRTGLSAAPLLLVASLLVVGFAVLLHWERHSTRSAIRMACKDAKHLVHAGLLDDAEVSYMRIADVGKRRDCPQHHPTVSDYRGSAASLAARGEAYSAAVRLGGVPRGSDARDRAARRAVKALIASLTLDPYNTQVRDELRRTAPVLPAPRTRADTDVMCGYASELRLAHLLDDAEAMYARSLRSGRNTSCLRRGLAAARRDEREAHRKLLEARTDERRGKKSAARAGYLAALARDASLADARTALAHLRAPDPRKNSRAGLTLVTGHDALDWLTNAMQWMGKHLAVGVAVAVGGLLLAWLVMGVILFSTRIKLWRRLLDPVPFMRRYTRTRTRVAAFTPEEKGSSCGSVFAHYLSMPPIKRGKERAPEDAALDRFEAATVSDRVGFASVLATVPEAGALAAAATWFVENAPRREARLFGQLLSAGPNRFGLRVIVVSRSGQTIGSETFWSADLPGPAFGPGDEDAARTALSIVAAAWAHEKVSA